MTRATAFTGLFVSTFLVSGLAHADDPKPATATSAAPSTASAQPSSAASPTVAPAASGTAPAVVAPVPTSGATGPAAAAEATDGDKPAKARAQNVHTLRECLELADRNHPSLMAARARLGVMRAQVDEAHTAPFSSFTLVAGAAPAPTFRGGPVYTQDREVGLNGNIGMAWGFSVDGTVPIWTFGKVTNLWKAADAQVLVGQQDVRKVRNQIHLDVRKAYYGLQLARDGLALLDEASSKLEKAIGSLEEKVKTGDGDEIDLLRLKTAMAELQGRRAEAEKGQRVALAALRFLTGSGSQFDIPDVPLKPPRHGVQAVDTYIDASRMYRPEILMARAGVAARTAQTDLARSKLLPDIALTLSASYRRAPEITDQTNPFVRDDANFLRYGVGVGMRWSLDFLPASARIRQADSQLEENKQLLRYATGGVSVEVESAYASVVEAKKKHDAFSNASKLARQWMIRVAQNMDLGTSEEKDLVEPARQYALQRYNYLSATMDLNMAMAQLALATGWDALAEASE
jgi:outer membrane protein TolC